MKFHALQFNAILHDWEANRREVEKLIVDIKLCDGDFILLQEMTDTGWSMKLDRITGIGTVAWACELSDKYNCWLQVGWVDSDGDRGKNCVTICSPIGEPIYTYSLKQGIEDGFLAPYKVVRIDIDKDLEGWRPTEGKCDNYIFNGGLFLFGHAGRANGDLIGSAVYHHCRFY